MSPQQGKLYYDDTCAICRSGAERAKEWSDIELHGITQGLPEGITSEALNREVHFVDEDGVTYKGIEAIIEILQRSSRWNWTVPLVSARLMRPIAKIVYGIVARLRHRV